MIRGLSNAVICVAVILAGLITMPRSLMAESCLRNLQGGRVAVTTKNGTVVRGWLLRVGPKKILLGCDNNTFVRIRLYVVAKVQRVPASPGVHLEKAQLLECNLTAPKRRPALARPRPSAGRAIALRLRANADRLRKIGMGITIGGLSLGVAGTGVLVAGIIMNAPEFWLAGFGIAIIGLGTTVIGTPIWIVGHYRVKKADRRLNEHQADPQPHDPVHERRMYSRLMRGQPRPTVLSWRFQF